MMYFDPFLCGLVSWNYYLIWGSDLYSFLLKYLGFQSHQVFIELHFVIFLSDLVIACLLKLGLITLLVIKCPLLSDLVS